MWAGKLEESIAEAQRVDSYKMQASSVRVRRSRDSVRVDSYKMQASSVSVRRM